MNAHLRPHPVAVLAAEPAADDFHARFSATGRRYFYRVISRRADLALERDHAWKVPRPLDAEAMHAAAQRLVGRHDFTTFRAAECQAASPVKTLDRLDVERLGHDSFGDEVRIHAEARSFLHHQVRSMVGTLVKVGEGGWTPDDVSAALEARDRTRCGPMAPAAGLYLAEVTYPEAQPRHPEARASASLEGCSTQRAVIGVNILRGPPTRRAPQDDVVQQTAQAPP